MTQNERQILMEFIEWPTGEYCPFDWNFFHKCWDKYRPLVTGNFDIDAWHQRSINMLANQMTYPSADNSLAILSAHVKTYNSAIKI